LVDLLSTQKEINGGLREIELNELMVMPKNSSAKIFLILLRIFSLKKFCKSSSKILKLLSKIFLESFLPILFSLKKLCQKL